MGVPDDFLATHWQKRPLLRRAAVAIELPATDALVALSRREGVVSRRIGDTVLIQEADRHLRACAELLESFRIVPNWRIDDVMVSVAPDGGGIGPHTDRYDVFLVQARGGKRWRLGTGFDEVLGPGDWLYLPPGVEHDGVAVGESVTCSVGFRVPDPRELCSGFLRQLSPAAFERIRHADPDATPPRSLGEIPKAARESLREGARSLFDGRAFDHWVGVASTTPLRGDGPEPTTRVDLTVGRFERSAPSHFAWLRDDDGTVQLFVGGERYPLGHDGEAVAELLCGRRVLDREALAPLVGHARYSVVIADLVCRGYLREAS